MSTILFMIHTIVQIVSRLLCNNALFFQRCPSHPMALCDLRQRAKAPQRHVQLWLDWKWLDDFLVWSVTASPGISAGDWSWRCMSTTPPTTFLPTNVKIFNFEGMNWMNESKIPGGCSMGTPSPASHLPSPLWCLAAGVWLQCYLLSLVNVSRAPVAVQHGEQAPRFPSAILFNLGI